MLAKQIIGFSLLGAFILSMVVKFVGNVSKLHDSASIIFFVAVIGSLLFLGIRQILRS